MNSNKKRIVGITFLIGIVLIILAVYLYYQQGTDEKKENQMASNVTTEEADATEVQETTTDETIVSKETEGTTDMEKQEAATTAEKKQNKKLPDNYEWDEKQWGEPPQIVYDFAENQERFDFIVNEIDSLLSEGEGFTTRRNNDKLYSKSENGEQLKKDINYLLNNTKFYKLTKYESEDWGMMYNQEEHRERYTYMMIYDPKMTKQEACDIGYIKVVGDWYFIAAPLA